MSLINCRSCVRKIPWRKVSNFVLLLLIVILAIALLQGRAARAETIPQSVHSRYTSLANNFAKAPQETKFHRDIAAFYRLQLSKSVTRQLLASNLHLQVLLQQQAYAEAYQVVAKLLPQKLDLSQELQFQQLASQLVLSKNNHENATLGKQEWSLAIKHLHAWFNAVTAANAKIAEKTLTVAEINRFNISSKQQAINAALLAQAYYQIADTRAALPWAQKAYQTMPDNEAYLQLLLALYERLEMHPSVNQLLAVAVVDFPKSKHYWSRWAYSFLRLDLPNKALSTLAIARNQGKLDKQGYGILASLYLSQQQPRLSAQVLLEGRNRQLLSEDEQFYKNLTNAWLLARDRQQALMTYAQAEAAGIKLTKSQQRQAQLAYIEGDWSNAELIYTQLLQDIVGAETVNDDQSKAQQESWRFMLAMTQVQQHKNNLAKANLEKLTSKKYRRYAKNWLAQISG